MYKLRAKSLEVKSLYELFVVGEKDYEDVATYLKNFEKWLRDHKNQDLAEEKAKPYINFVLLLRKILKTKNIVNAKERKVTKGALLKELEKSKPISFQSWLKDKIEAL